MDAATKQFLEQMQATLEDSIMSSRNASIARHEVLVQKLELLASVQASSGTSVVGPVPASSGTAELVPESVVATDASSSTAKDPEVLQVAGDAPPVCIEMAPSTCSMACPTQVVTNTNVDPKAGVQEFDGLSVNTTESTPVSTPAAAPTSPSATVDVIPMLATAAASNGTLSRELIKGAASTRPWLEPVPPRPPDPWSLSPGAWPDSRPKACITVQSAVNRALLCNDTEEIPTYVLSDEVPQQDEVQRQPWPPPPEFCENSLCEELKEIFGNAASFGLQHCSSNCPRGTTLATLESQMLQLFDLLEGANQLKCTKRAQGFTGELLVEAGIRQNIEVKQSDTSTRDLFLDHHSRLGFVILGVLVTCFSRVQILTLAFKKTSFQIDPMSLQEFIDTSYCYLHFGAAQNLGTLVCCAWAVLRLLSGAARCDLFHGEWVPDSSGPAYTNATCQFSEVLQNCMSNGRPDDGYLYWKWKTYGYDMLPPFDDKTFLDDFWLTWDPGWTSHCIIIFCWHERSDNCSLLWARWFTWYQWYNSSSTWTCFGVGLFNAILLQNWLLSWFIGQNTQWGFELLQLKTAHSPNEDVYRHEDTQPAIYAHKSWDPRGVTMPAFNLQSSKILMSMLTSQEAQARSGMSFSQCSDQEHFQGGGNVIVVVVAAGFVQGYVDHKYYISFYNDYLLDISFDRVTICHGYCNPVVQVNHDFELVKEHHVHWDPGGSRRRRLGVKPNFKEGGMLGALLTCTHTWACPLGQLMGLAAAATYSWEKATYGSSG